MMDGVLQKILKLKKLDVEGAFEKFASKMFMYYSDQMPDSSDEDIMDYIRTTWTYLDLHERVKYIPKAVAKSPPQKNDIKDSDLEIVKKCSVQLKKLTTGKKLQIKSKPTKMQNDLNQMTESDNDNEEEDTSSTRREMTSRRVRRAAAAAESRGEHDSDIEYLGDHPVMDRRGAGTERSEDTSSAESRSRDASPASSQSSYVKDSHSTYKSCYVKLRRLEKDKDQNSLRSTSPKKRDSHDSGYMDRQCNMSHDILLSLMRQCCSAFPLEYAQVLVEAYHSLSERNKEEVLNEIVKMY